MRTHCKATLTSGTEWSNKSIQSWTRTLSRKKTVPCVKYIKKVNSVPFCQQTLTPTNTLKEKESMLLSNAFSSSVSSKPPWITWILWTIKLCAFLTSTNHTILLWRAKSLNHSNKWFSWCKIQLWAAWNYQLPAVWKSILSRSNHVEYGSGLNWSTSSQLFQNLAWAVFFSWVIICVAPLIILYCRF